MASRLKLAWSVRMIERLMKHVSPEPNTGCWLWTASVKPSGHPQIRVGKKTRYAHRLMWILYNRRIPKRKEIRHRCDQPSCINPQHLELGSHADNMRDMALRNRNVGTRSLSAIKVAEIKVALSKGVLHRIIAKKYKVHRSTITLINRGMTWSHV